MKLVKLTNLGNLTIQNLNNLDEKYRENADAKRKKLAKLWDPVYSMEFFYRTFSSDYSILNPPVLSDHENGFRTQVLGNLETMGLIHFEETDSIERSIAQSIIQRETNPIQNLRKVDLELTGLCNLKCRHCYRGGSRSGEYGLPVDVIKQSLDPLFRAGITSLTITGGEPTIRKDDLLEIIDYASQFLELKGVSLEERMTRKYHKLNPTIEDVLKMKYYQDLREKLMDQLSWSKEELIGGNWNICERNTPEDVEKILRDQAAGGLESAQRPSSWGLDHIGLLSNGYFDNPEEFLKMLQGYNVSLQLSLDSFNGHTTNRNRGEIGVFGSVKNLVSISNSINFPVDITGHNIGGTNTETEKRNERYFNSNSHLMVLPGMLQLGNSIPSGFKPDKHSRSGRIGDISSKKRAGNGWCTGWTTPQDIHIKPTGVVGNCLYAYAVPEEFGNLNSQRMENILNGIQNTMVYQMFRDGTIERSQHELDKSIFGRRYSSPCELIALTLTYATIKEKMIQDGVKNPRKRANEEVARIYKFSGEEK